MSARVEERVSRRGAGSATAQRRGGIAYRTVRALHFDPRYATILGDEDASARLTRAYRAPWGFARS